MNEQCKCCIIMVLMKEQAEVIKKQKLLIAELRKAGQTKIDFKFN